MNNLEALTHPISEEEVEWRVQRTGVKNGKPWAIIVPYVQSRAIMARLDEAVGPFGWSTHFDHIEHDGKLNFICTLSIKDEDGNRVGKQDGAPATDIESFKGGISDALKRVGVQWGIGRDLYKIRGTVFANFSDTGQHSTKIDGKWYKWDAPPLAAILGEATHPSHGGHGTASDSPPDDSARVASKLIDEINSMDSNEKLEGWLAAAKSQFVGTMNKDDAARVNGALKQKREELAS